MGILKFAMVATPLFAVLHCAGIAFSDREAGLRVLNKGIMDVIFETAIENTLLAKTLSSYMYLRSLNAWVLSRRKPQSGGQPHSRDFVRMSLHVPNPTLKPVPGVLHDILRLRCR